MPEAWDQFITASGRTCGRYLKTYHRTVENLWRHTVAPNIWRLEHFLIFNILLNRAVLGILFRNLQFCRQRTWVLPSYIRCRSPKDSSILAGLWSCITLITERDELDKGTWRPFRWPSLPEWGKLEIWLTVFRNHNTLPHDVGCMTLKVIPINQSNYYLKIP